MHPFETRDAHAVFLSATLPASDNRRRVHLILRDREGAHGSGVLDLKTVPDLETGESWSEFRDRYAQGRTLAQDQRIFGLALHQAVLAADPSLARAWSAIEASAARGPLDLTLALGPGTELFAALPLELWHDDTGFCFARPDSALVRSFEHNPAADFELSAEARALFAWACPPGAGDPFDPEPHASALRASVGARLDILADATLAGIDTRLREARERGDPYRLIHLLAHGSRAGDYGSVALADGSGGIDPVEPRRLANALAGSGLAFAFLCSCQSAVAGERVLSGLAQLLLSPAGADLAAVVATQANLPVERSAELAAGVYRQLAEGFAPGRALARARVLAYQGTPLAAAWAAPICLARPRLPVPDAAERARDYKSRSGLPPRRDTFQPRPAVMAEILPELRRHRLVSLAGLPGIGKTELGKEAARLLSSEPNGPEVLFVEATRGIDSDRLRSLLAARLGLSPPPETDGALAIALDSEPRLVLVDNAEDLMADAAAQAELAAQLDDWLAGAPRLRVLLTTRWPVSGTREREHVVHIPPMTRAETESLLLAELADSGALTPERRAEWTADLAWQRLLDFLDGHARSVWLVSHHFEGPRASLGRIVERLERSRAAAIVDPSLIGRADLHAGLPAPAQRRMQSLVASIDFSFDVLARRHPQAARAFLLLAVFPAGLPEPVALAVLAAAEAHDSDSTEADATGGEAEGRAADRLDQLYRYRLLEWQGHRTYYPVPLRWYAEHKAAQQDRAPLPDLEVALSAYGAYVETLDTGLRADPGPTWIDAWLREERTLLWLVGEARPPAVASPGGPSDRGIGSPIARLASAATNLLALGHRLDAWRRLADAGLIEARAIGDRLGEANTLRALGDLALRTARLEEAGAAYGEALPLFRGIM